jgi:very-short-patch-repair endonuclease
LDGNGYRLPTHAGHLVPEARARPDFAYLSSEVQCAVFMDDGAVHGDAGERDDEAEDRLWDMGWHVVRLRDDEREWQQAANRLPSVFGSGVRR